MTGHWSVLEIARVITGGFGVCLCAWLWLVKRSAYEQVKRDGVNGAVLALARERLRHRFFMVGFAVALAVSAVLRGDARAGLMTGVNVALVVDAIMAFRARQLVNVLVQEYYHRHGKGRRATDPR